MGLSGSVWGAGNGSRHLWRGARSELDDSFVQAEGSFGSPTMKPSDREASFAAGEAAGVFPVYHVFAGFAELTRLAEARFSDVRTSLQLAALAGLTETGRTVLWLANLTAAQVAVRIKTQTRFRDLSAKTLDEHNAPQSLGQPEAWWRNSPAGPARDPASIVNLPRYALARLELEP